MHLLYSLADTFYRTFGITEPSPAARRRSAFFFLALLLFVPFAIATVVYIVTSSIHR